MRARRDSKGDGLQAAPGSRNVTESPRASFREAEQKKPFSAKYKSPVRGFLFCAPSMGAILEVEVLP